MSLQPNKMDNEPDRKNEAKARAGSKKPYKTPSIVRWGTLLEMTQANGGTGRPDGGRKPYRRTR